MTSLSHFRLRSIALSTVVLGVVALSLVLVATDRPLGYDLTHDGLLAWIKSLGNWGGVAIISLMIIHSFIPFPAELVTFIAGNLFGVMWGSIFAWIGAMLGACLAFALSRALGRQFVVGVLPQDAHARLDKWSMESSATALLVARLVPLIAFNMINYAAGLTRVGWWTFIWTTAIGILPLTIFFVYLGERMRTSSTHDWLIIFAGAVLIVILAKIAQRAWCVSKGIKPQP